MRQEVERILDDLATKLNMELTDEDSGLELIECKSEDQRSFGRAEGLHYAIQRLKELLP